MNEFAKKADISFIASMAGYVMQIIVIMLSTLWLVPTHKQPNLIVCAFILAPLLVLLPWLIKRSIRAHIWLCFMMLGYFMTSVKDVFMPAQYGMIFPLVEVFVSVYLFCAAMLFARWEQKRYQISVTR